MPKKWYTPEQIIQHLGRLNYCSAKGATSLSSMKRESHPADLLTLEKRVRWDAGGQVRRLKELEQESSPLKKVVADFALDNAILKEKARGNF